MAAQKSETHWHAAMAASSPVSVTRVWWGEGQQCNEAEQRDSCARKESRGSNARLRARANRAAPGSEPHVRVGREKGGAITRQRGRKGRKKERKERAKARGRAA